LLTILGYLQLVFFSFLAATFLPFSSEVIISTMYLSNNFNTLLLLIVASTGNISGSIFNWYLGKKILIFKTKRWFPISEDGLNKSQIYFQKYGVWSLLLAWVPIIGDPLTMIAGVLKVKFKIFFILVSISKISRYIFIIFLSSLI
jgi:membrane protein YqaA with SNARE-associated domain